MREVTEHRREIGNRIRTLRKSQGCKLQDLASEAGLSAGYLSDVERGQSAVSSEKLAAIARVLGATVDYLLSGTSSSREQDGSETGFPLALSEAAVRLDLSHEQTIRLLKGRSSLVARRSAEQTKEWDEQDWIVFYENVKDYL